MSTTDYRNYCRILHENETVFTHDYTGTTSQKLLSKIVINIQITSAKSRYNQTVLVYLQISLWDLLFADSLGCLVNFAYALVH